jgi:glycosyltransferase involved in cell wall biosynthesis
MPFLDSALVWPWCKSAVSKIMHEYPFDVVHTNFLFPGGYLGMKIKEHFGTPYIVHERSIQRMAAAQKHPSRGRLYRRILRNSDLIVTENSKMAARLRDMDPDVPEVKVIVQPGTHPEKASDQIRERPVEYSDKLVVLSVGALTERKGHAILIEAVAELIPRFPNLVCRIIGGGPEHHNLEALVDHLGVRDHIELLGKQPHVDVLGNMSWCDVFVLASWGEASGTVYGEAMQFGKPAIACADEGISELLEDGKHGRLVPARDVPALVEALRWLLEDEQRRSDIGEQARQLANNKLSYSAVAHELIDIYERLLEASGRRRHSSEPLLQSTERAGGHADNQDSSR